MVYNFIDYNGYLRYLLAQISEGIGNKKGDAFWNDYFSRLEQIKLKTPIIYKHIIGMVFADTYRIYCYIKDFLSLSKEEEEVFEFISSVRNIEDLFEVLKNNKLSLSDLIENSVAFALKDDYEKSLCYTASDLENTVADIVDEFIGDDDLMYLLIDDFLSITSGQYEIDEEEVEDCFENNVRDDVKRKLMQKD